MAYMNQVKKGIIKKELDKVMPKDWKWSLSVYHHSTIVLTIQSAPIDLLQIFTDRCNAVRASRGDMDLYGKVDNTGYSTVNPYWLENQFEGDLLEQFVKIKDALNTNNHDLSDIMTDYFDVGHYVDIKIGSYKKDFVVK